MALLLVGLSSLAARMAALLPACPFKSLSGMPCPSCGTTRAAVALARLDLMDAVAVNPLATLAWLGLIGGGLIAGLRAVCGKPWPEPRWQLSAPGRWLLLSVILANWIYLVGVGV